jgi:hypothetical protein
MRVSCAITAYNEKDYIEGCILSVLGQTYPVDEIIVVADSCTDGTVEIARRFPVEVVEVDYRDIYQSKREGLERASSNLVLCVDGDTWLDPYFVENGVTHILEGYEVATGYIYPVEDKPASGLISTVCNLLPKHFYKSGPAYILDKRRYVEVCGLERVNGYYDHCESVYEEIPLQRFKSYKGSDMVAYTEIPWGGSSRFMLLAGSVAFASGIFLFFRAIDS